MRARATSKRSSCLFMWKGEALGTSSTWAPASRAWAAGPGSQMSAQTLTPKRTPPHSKTQAPVPAWKVRTSSKTEWLGSFCLR
jgi:hypothetical protein